MFSSPFWSTLWVKTDKKWPEDWVLQHCSKVEKLGMWCHTQSGEESVSKGVVIHSINVAGKAGRCWELTTGLDKSSVTFAIHFSGVLGTNLARKEFKRELEERLAGIDKELRSLTWGVLLQRKAKKWSGSWKGRFGFEHAFLLSNTELVRQHRNRNSLSVRICHQQLTAGTWVLSPPIYYVWGICMIFCYYDCLKEIISVYQHNIQEQNSPKSRVSKKKDTWI